MFQTNEQNGPVLYVTTKSVTNKSATKNNVTEQATTKADNATTDTANQDKPERKPLFGAFSVKFIAYTSAIIIISLFLSLTVTNLFLSKSYYQGPDDNGLSLRLADKARAVKSQLAFFQESVNHVAAQPTTQDILENKDTVSAQTWAMQMRRFLPQANGVSLLTGEVDILGSPADSQLGPQSLTDLAKLSTGEKISMPPVHRLTAESSHFDLVAPVKDEADTALGMVFVSFRLNTLEPLLKGNTNSGQKLVLRDGSGNVITQHDRLDQEKDSATQKINVDNTDWQLSLSENIQTSMASFLSLVIFNISAFLLTVGIIAFMLRYAQNSLGRDFSQIKNLLNNLAEGEPVGENFTSPQLRETAEILPAISHIQRGMDKKQQLLQSQQLSNEITGLPNRRQFGSEFARAYDFARRGTNVCIVRLQVDGLGRLDEQQQNQVLKLLSKTLKEHVRKVDHIAHLDTADFALLMFGMSAEGATPCLERLRSSFIDKQAQLPMLPKSRQCGLHCGYTIIHPHRDNSAADVLKRAENALTVAQSSEQRSIIAA